MKTSTILTATLSLVVSTATASYGPIHCYDNGWSVDITGSPDMFMEVQKFCTESADKNKIDRAAKEIPFPKGDGNGIWNIEFAFSNLHEERDQKVNAKLCSSLYKAMMAQCVAGDLKHFKGGSHFEVETGGWSAAIDLTWEDAKELMDS